MPLCFLLGWDLGRGYPTCWILQEALTNGVSELRLAVMFALCVYVLTTRIEKKKWADRGCGDIVDIMVMKSWGSLHDAQNVAWCYKQVLGLCSAAHSFAEWFFLFIYLFIFFFVNLHSFSFIAFNGNLGRFVHDVRVCVSKLGCW